MWNMDNVHEIRLCFIKVIFIKTFSDLLKLNKT